jgi:hypothetical protein
MPGPVRLAGKQKVTGRKNWASGAGLTRCGRLLA